MPIRLPAPGAARADHRWRFFRSGGVDQVALRSGADLIHLDELDQKLWVALAAPTRGLEFDSRTLDLMDLDKDGRIRVTDVLAAIHWVEEHFSDPSNLFKGGTVVSLDAINAKTEPGAALLAGARRVLGNLGRPVAASISLEDVRDTSRIFAATRFNGDGIVPAESTQEADIRRAIEEIISTHGGLTDRSGRPGVSREKVESFFGEAAALLEWHREADGNRLLLPLGEGTELAAQASRAVHGKVEDYFTRCQLVTFDPRAMGPLNRAESDFLALAAKDLRIEMQEIAQLPLARVEAARPLPLRSGINPAWTRAIETFRENAVFPLLGNERETLTEAEWRDVESKLAPFEAWSSRKPATSAEKLGLPRLRALLESDARARILKLIEQDGAVASEFSQIAALEKLVLFQRDLVRLLNNFVNFSEFYGRREAVFQAGTLYMDGRSCELCIRVADPARHAAMAGLAQTFLAYCDCVRAGGEKMIIAAAFTDGDSDHLMAGRNGIFYDRQGRDWDATITKVITNPISIREAFWSPYKKLVRLVEEQIAKRAAAADTVSNQKLTTAAVAAANADRLKPGEKPVEPRKFDVGTVAALGVALGSIATFFGLLAGKFIDLGIWMPLGMLAVVLLISGPSMLLAWLKLRQRNLGPILDANGWAINGRARINVPFGGALTDVAKLPPGSERSLKDPYAEKRNRGRLVIAIGILLAFGALWYIGRLDRLLPGRAKSLSVLGTNAPAYRPAPVERGTNAAPAQP